MREVTDLYPSGIYRMSNGELRLAGWYDGMLRTYTGTGYADINGMYYNIQRHVTTDALEDDQATLVISIEDIMKTIKEIESA